MDYLCIKFGDFIFSRFGFIVRTDRQIDRITEADDRYTHATTVSVSNYIRILSLVKRLAGVLRHDALPRSMKLQSSLSS